MEKTKDVTPNDSRYIPMTQQDYCCVPTCIQIILYRNKIPLISAEELGYHLGLIVGPDSEHLFYNVRTSDEPPTSAGYGTQISNPEYNPNKVFEHFKIPLQFRTILANDIDTETVLKRLLKEIEANNSDALLCFNHSVSVGENEINTGHVVVFDRIIKDEVRVIDPSPDQPKWRKTKISLLFNAIKKHGNDNFGGIWYFERI